MPLPQGLSLISLIALAGCVLLGFTIEAALGFGAMLVSLALGSMWLPIPTLLPALVPLNLALSVWLTVRYARLADGRFLFRTLLPTMAMGLPVGIALYQLADAALLKRVFGAFLLTLSAVELLRMRGASADDAPARLARPIETALLLLGGIIHGAFSTGGPMAVYVTSRAVPDKGAYRATLSILWTVLGSVLMTSFALGGQIGERALILDAFLIPGCALGLVAGEIAHHRVPVALFRRAVYGVLAIAGALLLARG